MESEDYQVEKIITRFPPSPTGYLHVGGARTALFNWLYARQNGGTFILRLEDTDVARSSAEYVDAILEGMRWMGLDWDEGPYYQSQRTELYVDHIRRLLDRGEAYYCHCQPDELELKRKEALAQGRKPMYDRKCRDLGLESAKGAVVRLRAPVMGETRYHDLIKGSISFDNTELDDLILQRSDGTPTYHLAVVVDDITMNVTHVIRGDDHVNNTPRQILIYNALAVPLPRYAHVPMILGPDKTRLSKRHGATSVLAYRDMGYLPGALLNYLVRLGWSYGDQEIFSLNELLEKFSLENVGTSAGVFNPEKLLWLNSHYIKESDPAELVEPLIPFLKRAGVEEPDREVTAAAAATLQTRSKTLEEMAEGAAFYFRDVVDYDENALKKFLKPDLAPLFEALASALEGLEPWDEVHMQPIFEQLMERYEVKFGRIAQPLRVSLTGKTVSPGIFEVLEVLGREKTLKRIRAALVRMKDV